MDAKEKNKIVKALKYYDNAIDNLGEILDMIKNFEKNKSFFKVSDEYSECKNNIESMTENVSKEIRDMIVEILLYYNSLKKTLGE